jgi:hypothetical protein
MNAVELLMKLQGEIFDLRYKLRTAEADPSYFVFAAMEPLIKEPDPGVFFNKLLNYPADRDRVQKLFDVFCKAHPGGVRGPRCCKKLTPCFCCLGCLREAMLSHQAGLSILAFCTSEEASQIRMDMTVQIEEKEAYASRVALAIELMDKGKPFMVRRVGKITLGDDGIPRCAYSDCQFVGVTKFHRMFSEIVPMDAEIVVVSDG